MDDTPDDPSRRRLFGRLIKRSAEHATRVVEEAVVQRLPPRRRPPGAVIEPLFLAACTCCNACVEVCPERAIHTLAPQIAVGPGTPVMVPDARACTWCEDFPCIQVCEPKVLRLDLIPTSKLGTVRINPTHCLPFRGPECGACAGICPTPEPALILRLGRPQINAEICVGCGLCIPNCPTQPKAIELAPLEV